MLRSRLGIAHSIRYPKHLQLYSSPVGEKADYRTNTSDLDELLEPTQHQYTVLCAVRRFHDFVNVFDQCVLLHGGQLLDKGAIFRHVVIVFDRGKHLKNGLCMESLGSIVSHIRRRV